MTEEQAIRIASFLKSTGQTPNVWHSGGGVWLCSYQRGDGKCVCFSEDCVCLYESQEALYEGEQEIDYIGFEAGDPKRIERPEQTNIPVLLSSESLEIPEEQMQKLYAMGTFTFEETYPMENSTPIPFDPAINVDHKGGDAFIRGHVDYQGVGSCECRFTLDTVHQYFLIVYTTTTPKATAAAKEILGHYHWLREASK